jgi:predicted TIM-barrel fold metal-dependent hydrolase
VSVTLFRIDCDLHLPQVEMKNILPYLDDYRHRQIVDRDRHAMPFRLASYPPNAPITHDAHYAGMSVPGALDACNSSLAVTSMLHEVLALHNPDMRAVLISAVNDYVVNNWLNVEQRPRGSILVSGEDPIAAVAEIKRLSGDTRFVQVIFLAMQEIHHGARHHWPIYAAAEKHGQTIASHAGTIYRLPLSVSGWPSYQLEDYVLQSGVFENIPVGLLGEGVLKKFPKLQFVFLESGFTWLPTLMWRCDKTWRGV